MTDVFFKKKSRTPVQTEAKEEQERGTSNKHNNVIVSSAEILLLQPSLFLSLSLLISLREKKNKKVFSSLSTISRI